MLTIYGVPIILCFIKILYGSYTLDETLPFQKLYLLLAQNRDYNRSPTPVYDMAPFLHCACVRSAIFLASKTAASK